MIIFFGVILIVYGIIAILLLFRLRLNIIKFWDNQVEKLKDLISVSSDLTIPIKIAAQATNNGGIQISNLVTNLRRKIPETISKILRTLLNLVTNMEKVQDEVQTFVKESEKTMSDIIFTVNQSVQLLLKESIPATLEFIKDTAKEIHQAKYWPTNEMLKQLVDIDLIPHNIVNLLIPLIDTPYDTDDLLTESLKNVLTQDEFNNYSSKILKRFLNNDYDTGFTATLESARISLLDISENTLPSLSKMLVSAKDPISMLIMLASDTSGVLLPLSAGVKAFCETYITVFGGTDGLYVPPIPIHLGAKIDKGFLLSINVAGKKIRVPSSDVNIDIVDINEGEWLSVDLSSMLSDVKELRSRADQTIDAIRSGTYNFDIRDKLQSAGDALQELSIKLFELSNDQKRMPAQIKSLKNQATRLAKLAHSYETVAAELGSSLMQVNKQFDDILKLVITFSDQILNSVKETLINVKNFIELLNEFNIDTELQNLSQLSEELVRLAESIDNGKPIGTPNKGDIVQKITDTFKAMNQAIPQRENVIRIINGIFATLILLHVAFFITGIVMLQ